MKITATERPWCFDKQDSTKYRETSTRFGCYLEIGCWRCLSFMRFPWIKVLGYPGYFNLGWKCIRKVSDNWWIRYLCPWCVEEEKQAWRDHDRS